MGVCPGCRQWNSFVEEPVVQGPGKCIKGVRDRKLEKPMTLLEIESSEDERNKTGIGELDRVLGGGIVKGSLVLLGGDPGIGKSTILLQVCQELGKTLKILYVSGEESLRQIKLLRKLGVPLEEIRQMQTGSRTLGDGMRRHLVTLERERKNLDQAVQFCQALKDREVRLDSLDAGGLLREMEQMEQEGATFLDRQQGDTRRIRYVAPVVVTLLTVFLMGGLIALMLWGFSIDAEDAPPLPLLVVLVAIPGVVILGVLLAMIQRFREIEKGEAEDAKQY